MVEHELVLPPKETIIRLPRSQSAYGIRFDLIRDELAYVKFTISPGAHARHRVAHSASFRGLKPAEWNAIMRVTPDGIITVFYTRVIIPRNIVYALLTQKLNSSAKYCVKIRKFGWRQKF